MCSGLRALLLLGLVGLAPGPARADEASDAFQQGRRLLARQKPREAAALFRKVLQLRLDYPQAAHLGDALFQLGRDPEALAAAGKGEDAKNLSPEQRGKLRRQALDWLRADLAAYTKHAEKDNKAARQLVQQRLPYWLQDADLATVREAKALAALPEAERKQWDKLWQDVAALRKRCQ